METTTDGSIASAGQAGWTRDLARDLFPGPVTPFTWTLLAAPAERALQNAYVELGGQAVPGVPFWRLDGGYAYLNAAAVAEADQSLCGAGWMGRNQPQPRGGLRARLQASGVMKRCQARLAAAVAEAPGLQTRLSRWLAWVQGVKWTQADLLQVMEELEPHALAGLQIYFLVRIALNSASAAFESYLHDSLPTYPPELAASLALGTPGLPSTAMTEAILDAARRSPTDPERLATLARCGHRGPGEMRPDALRWPDAPELLSHLAAQGEPMWTPAGAAGQREQALGVLQKSVNDGEYRQLLDLLGDLTGTMRAVDIAWDSLTLVMAAAQRWALAAGGETLVSGLIARPQEVLYLELEELKQVATGEWHAGDREAVQAAVARRMQEKVIPPAATTVSSPVVVCPGACDGPFYCDSPGETLPAAGAVWLAEIADPGCAPFWGVAGCVLTTGDDEWSPGMVAARSIGVPSRVGAAPLGA